MRSTFFASLVGFLVLLHTASATFSQGLLEYTRDYALTYNHTKFATNQAFCIAFRGACVDYAGSIGEHHQVCPRFHLLAASHTDPSLPFQLDCVFNQTSTPIRAWCGGIKKSASGSWTANETQIDNTRPVVAAMGSKKVKITGKPMTYAKCLTAKRYNKAVVCVK
ncbi:hypothetical protein RQP46_002754 [Phenoliferia psychrophenolica]